MTGIYALVHMAVDLSCAFLVYTYVLGGEQWYLWLLLYNFCAFALQMPISTVQILVGIVAIGIVGYILAVAMRAIEARLCRWSVREK